MRETNGWRSIWIVGQYFPLLLLLLLYATIDSLVPCVLRLADAPTASPYHHDTTLTDGLGGSFSFSGIIHPSWIDGLVFAIVFGTVAQRAMFVAWAVFGLGRWNLRFGAALVSSALLYAILQVRLGAPFGSWEDAAAPYLAMPLEFLSFAAPLAVSAVCSGRRLIHKRADASRVVSARHFSIASLLWLTTAVAASVALARSTETIGGATLANSVRYSVSMLVYSTIYVLPLIWSALAIRRLPISLFLVMSITASFAGLFAMPWADDSTSALQLGMASGILLTAPCSLLLWRFCGYRLATSAPRQIAESNPTGQQTPDPSTLPSLAP